jgi:fatty-acyl-CoA synthase
MVRKTTDGIADRPGMATPQQPGMAYVRAIDSTQPTAETVARESGSDPVLAWLTDTGVESMTWAQLYARACATGIALLDLNPRRGRVALVAPNSVDWIVAMYGCAMAQMPVVPISPSVTDNEALHMVAQTRAALILAAEQVGDHDVIRRMTMVANQLSPQPIVRNIADFNEASTPTAPDPVAPASLMSSSFNTPRARPGCPRPPCCHTVRR